ncbi:phosphoribosylamine--glycine ligase [Sphingomonas oligoaromativorans]|uniref:phosphoribosylamine--glycine ligase n=1 Tax=Sphingomonas oligoaromativorans TaxID=575322 RepID=UPI001423886C|nr:phosphoribosylamine--glycine ligase [Sphingomonas oligoaromativorans]NIJ34441.1 phosphoribosylamine--glycine ligase [Sphingomonas oligoaromativorans]
MNVLLLGSGGREHALAWKLAQSPLLGTLYAAPGNPGIGHHAALVPLPLSDQAAILDFAREAEIDLVVIGPEQPLVEGLADTLRTAGIAVFGPSKAAAQLEGSKGFTKALCDRANVPTAAYAAFTNAAEAKAALPRFGLPVVIKADGLAAGKGVIIAISREEAEAAIDDMIGGRFGSAGASLVIEEFLEGEEVSLFALSDGKTVVALGSAQDHKRVGDGDTGPNTGGMGAYSPTRALTPELEARVMAEIVRPSIAGMAEAGMPFTGVLFAGLMLTAQGPKLIEYNVRFGDPECQVLMMRLDEDLLPLLHAAATATLEDRPIRWKDKAALTVVMAANNYPDTPETGGAIRGVDIATANGAQVFHAGTRAEASGLVAAGGRVLAVTALGDSVAEAQAAAYRAVDSIDFPTGFCRRDIGWREIARG